MFYAALYKMLCIAYAQFLRALVKNAIDDPNSEIDDIALSIMDKLFNYSE
jgi:hypothetical protein